MLTLDFRDASLRHHAKLEMHVDFRFVGAYSIHVFLVMVPGTRAFSSRKLEGLPALGVLSGASPVALNTLLEEAAALGKASVLSVDTVSVQYEKDVETTFAAQAATQPRD